jgi:hypothetical protein
MDRFSLADLILLDSWSNQVAKVAHCQQWSCVMDFQVVALIRDNLAERFLN